ncbi:MAG TPA: hypothetical protein VIO38_12050 [Rariglobus sp.]
MASFLPLFFFHKPVRDVTNEDRRKSVRSAMFSPRVRDIGEFGGVCLDFALIGRRFNGWTLPVTSNRSNVPTIGRPTMHPSDIKPRRQTALSPSNSITKPTFSEDNITLSMCDTAKDSSATDGNVTLAQFCQVLSALPPDDLIPDCGAFEAIAMRFISEMPEHHAGDGCESDSDDDDDDCEEGISQYPKHAFHPNTLSAPADALLGRHVISLRGPGSVKAKDLAAALGRYLLAHADVCVCHAGKRIVLPIVKLSLCTDGVFFMDTGMAGSGSGGLARAVCLARDLASNATTAEQVLVDAVRPFVPALWVLRLYKVGTRILTDAQMHLLLPRLTPDRLPLVFKPVGHSISNPKNVKSLAVRLPPCDHGEFLLYAAPSDVDFETLTGIFGPKVSKVERFLRSLATKAAAAPKPDASAPKAASA